MEPIRIFQTVSPRTPVNKVKKKRKGRYKLRPFLFQLTKPLRGYSMKWKVIIALSPRVTQVDSPRTPAYFPVPPVMASRCFETPL